VPSLEAAIDHWRAARYQFQTEPPAESLLTYNFGTDDLEAVWRRWFPQHAETAGAFERFRFGLIAAEDE